MKQKTLKITFILLSLFFGNVSFSQRSLTNAQVYDFNVGDIIQGKHFMKYEGSLSGFNGPPSYETHYILKKYTSKLADTVFYKIKREYYTPKTCDTCFTSYITDTITQYYSNLTQVADHYNTTDKLDINDTLYFNTCNRKIWEKSPIIDSSKIAGAMIHKTYFIEGLGGPYFTKVEPQGPVYSEFVLTYFQKSNESCGTFISASSKKLNDLNISIYPNPTNDKFTISVAKPFKNATLKFYTTNGKLLHTTTNIQTQIIEIQRNNLQPGVYMIQLNDLTTYWSQKLMIVD